MASNFGIDLDLTKSLFSIPKTRFLGIEIFGFNELDLEIFNTKSIHKAWSPKGWDLRH